MVQWVILMMASLGAVIIGLGTELTPMIFAPIFWHTSIFSLGSSLYAVLYTGLAKFSGGRCNLSVAFHILGYTYAGTSLILIGLPFDQSLIV